MKRVLLRAGSAILVLIAVVALFNRPKPCVGNPTATIPYVGFQPPKVAVGERQVLRRLVAMIANCPNAKSYTIRWDEPGTKFGGVRPHITIYEPSIHRFRDADELGGDPLNLVARVSPQEIARVASSTGRFGDLRGAVRRK